MVDADRFIGPYRLVGPLGQGGMGVVYRAEHVATGRRVALKTVRLADAVMLGSIRREIHELQRLRHPGVVRVLDDGVVDGTPWYAMEFIDGVTLRAFNLGRSASDTFDYTSADVTDETVPASTVEFRRDTAADPENGCGVTRAARRRPLREALSVARRLCSALSYIHGEGIVHRDLKPDNILVLPSDQPMLVDFGIASRFGGGSGRDVLQVDGGMAGTLAYMAPEQIRGEQVDARSDIYALGCILFELITGRPPFHGPTPVVVARAHQYVEPTHPSLLALDVSPELDDLVMQMLEKDPGRRLGYADDVAARLARVGAANGLPGPRPRPYLYRPGFAGRRDGLARLAERYAPAWDHPPSVVFVGGESGIGKTRLMREVARRVEAAGTRVLTGECSPYVTADAGRTAAGSHLLEPLRSPLLAIADRCAQRGLEETERLLGPRGPLLATYEPRLLQLPGQHAHVTLPEQDPAAARKQLFVALFETFAALATDRPLLVIIDDVQWVDELTLGFLEYTVGECRHGVLPFGIFATYRSDEVGASLARLIDAPPVVVMPLDRLDDADVSAIVRDMLALDPAPRELCSTLNRLSEGNPFFIAEYMRAAIEDGILARDEAGRWRFVTAGVDASGPSDLERLPLPGTIRELIQRRIAGLDPVVLAVAEAASVLGRDADPELLRTVCDLDVPAVDGAIAELARHHVIEDAPDATLRFAHEQIREVIYARLSSHRRTRLHLMAATALSRGANRDNVQGVLGVHWERAGEPDRARMCYLAGARIAARKYAFAEAERLYKAYLALRAEPSPELVLAMNELGHDVLRTQGRPLDGLAIQQQALGIARAIGDRGGEGRSLRTSGLLLKETGEIGQAEERLVNALAIAEAEGDRLAEETTCNYLAGVYYERGQLERALKLYERGMAIVRELGDDRNEAVLLSNIAIIHVERGRWQPARDAYESAIAIQTRIGDLHCLLATLSNYAFLQSEAGRFDSALALYERALELTRTTRRRRFEGIVLSNMADHARDVGDLERARTLCDESIAIHEETGNRRWLGITLEALASIAMAAGHYDEADALLDKATEIHRTLGNIGYEASALVLRAAIARRRGDTDRAAECLERAEPVIASMGDPRIRASWMCEAGHVALARGGSAAGALDAVRMCTAGLGLEPASRLGREITQLEMRITQCADAGGT